MIIKDDTLNHLASLSRLKIKTDKERETYSYELNKILDYVKKLDKVDTDEVDPTIQPYNDQTKEIARNTDRRDKVESSHSRDELLECSPLRDEDYIKVKKVIK